VSRVSPDYPLYCIGLKNGQSYTINGEYKDGYESDVDIIEVPKLYNGFEIIVDGDIYWTYDNICHKVQKL